MKLKIPQAARCRSLTGWLATGLAVTVAAVTVAMVPTPALAIATPVPLGTAGSFSVLAGSTVTNTTSGNTVLGQSLGVSPGSAITGFPPGQVKGAIHLADEVADNAKSDLVTAYNYAAAEAPNFALAAGISTGTTLIPGVYKAVSGVGITGDLVLDAGGNPDAVWVFQIPESLTTASSSRILLTNGASACNVYWQIGASATLGTHSTFVGTIMALASITVTTGTNIEGRALARTGAVTLDDNRIFAGSCSTATTGTTNGVTTGITTGLTTGSTGSTTGSIVGLTGGPVVGAPLVTGGATLGNTAGNTVGNEGDNLTAGNSAGNTAGNTAGNNVTTGNTSGNTTGNTSGNTTGITSGSTSGNSAGNTTGNLTGGPEGNAGGPDHEGGPEGAPVVGPENGHDQGGKPGEGDEGAPGKPDHGHGTGPGKFPGNYGYGNVPKVWEHEGDKG
jgi:hypothetical protein